MAGTLNQYASRVANILNQPNNHELKERVKNALKSYIATYIIKICKTEGIQDYYKIPLEVSIEPIANGNKITALGNHYLTSYQTSSIIPKPVRISNDAPFILVALKDLTTGHILPIQYNSQQMVFLALTSLPTSISRIYTFMDNKITINVNINSSLYTKFDISNTKLYIVGIWENPEAVLGYYTNDDMQDIELPFPEDIIGYAFADMLKTEFGIADTDNTIITK